ncbi:MAG: ABC transporter ATP-binding protein [Acidimicrobiia bacterium]|nr:MAG: ABC transporter ATP-binding protein [Acidimicrobiia bacterium]
MAVVTVLQLADVSVRFGGLWACQKVSFEIAHGELFAIIGPNGAGKTTVVNAITGVYVPAPGSVIRFTDRAGTTHDLVGRRPYQIVRLGIARTFQNLGLFDALTVLQNLMLGRYIYRRANLLQAGFWTRRAVDDEVANRAKVEEVIDLLEISQYRREKVGELPYGIRKRVELGRALAQEPDLLLLDEPMAGMNVEEKQDMVRFIYDARRQLSTTMVLIEHDMGVVMSIADRIAVLNFGELIALGTPEQVQQDPQVIAAYLGTRAQRGD